MLYNSKFMMYLNLIISLFIKGKSLKKLDYLDLNDLFKKMNKKYLNKLITE